MKKAKLSFTHAHSTYKSSKRDGNVLKHLVNLVLKGRAKIDRKPAIFLFQGYVNKEKDDSYRKIRNLYNI